jgi:membrane-associated phospholipid phosphatase
LLTAASLFFHHSYYPLAVIFYLLAILSMDKEKRLPLTAALILAVVSVAILKPLFLDPRPCALSGFETKVSCPSSFGMPSAHTLLASVFAVASVGSEVFFFFGPIALLVGLSRVYLGVHSVAQAGAGLALAFVLFAFAKAVCKSELVQPIRELLERI